MTMNQAAALRIKRTQRADLSPCRHVDLELEWNEWGDSDGQLCVHSLRETCSTTVPSCVTFPQVPCTVS